MERRLTAILAADVAGYSRHTADHEEISTATLRAHLAVVRESIAAHKGHIFTTAGDGVVAEFLSVVQAVRCAVEIQSKIAARNASLPEKERMRFRIGVNLSDVISEDNDLYGTGVNVAVRLEQLAQPGEILVSRSVHDQVRKIVEFSFEDTGDHRLKNIAGPVRAYRVLTAPLPWHEALWSHSKIYLGRPGVVALVFLLMLGVAAGTSYHLRQPASLWSTLLSDVPKRVMIAVFPFVNKSNDPAKNHFISNLTEDIAAELSRMRDVSVFEYQGKPVGTLDIGRGLKARYVLEGSVTPSGGDLFYIRATLKDLAKAGTTIWKKRFNRTIAERSLFDDEIACEIGARIAGGYGAIESNQAESAEESSPEELQPDDRIAQARKLVQYAWTKEKFDDARKLLREALKLDPDSLPAQRELTWLNLMAVVFEFDAPSEPLKEIAKATIPVASRLIEREPEDGRTRMVRATAYFFANDLNRFKDDARLALKDASCDAQVLAVLGALLGNSGEWSEAVTWVERANALNAAAAEGWFHSTMYLNYYFKHDYERALEMIRKSPDFSEGLFYAYYDYLAICGQLGHKHDEAERPQSGEDTGCVEPSVQEAWDSILEQVPGATAATFREWYRSWNFGDDDIEELARGASKTGVFEAKAKVQPVAQEHGVEPSVER